MIIKHKRNSSQKIIIFFFYQLYAVVYSLWRGIAHAASALAPSTHLKLKWIPKHTTEPKNQNPNPFWAKSSRNQRIKTDPHNLSLSFNQEPLLKTPKRKTCHDLVPSPFLSLCLFCAAAGPKTLPFRRSSPVEWGSERERERIECTGGGVRKWETERSKAEKRENREQRSERIELQRKRKRIEWLRS